MGHDQGAQTGVWELYGRILTGNGNEAAYRSCQCVTGFRIKFACPDRIPNRTLTDTLRSDETPQQNGGCKKNQAAACKHERILSSLFQRW
jgi:hypothetical protein